MSKFLNIMQAKGRDCVVPELSRNHNIGAQVCIECVLILQKCVLLLQKNCHEITTLVLRSVQNVFSYYRNVFSYYRRIVTKSQHWCADLTIECVLILQKCVLLLQKCVLLLLLRTVTKSQHWCSGLFCAYYRMCSLTIEMCSLTTSPSARVCSVLEEDTENTHQHEDDKTFYLSIILSSSLCLGLQRTGRGYREYTPT